MGLEQQIKETGIYMGKTVGDSMSPMLVQERDTVIIKAPVFPLKKYDVPVYRRGDGYTMHRIIKVKKNGDYIICGDNRTKKERDVTEDMIVGVLFAFYQDGKYVECTDPEYIRYSKKVCRSYPIRYTKHLFERIVRKLGRVFKKKK